MFRLVQIRCTTQSFPFSISPHSLLFDPIQSPFHPDVNGVWRRRLGVQVIAVKFLEHKSKLSTLPISSTTHTCRRPWSPPTHHRSRQKSSSCLSRPTRPKLICEVTRVDVRLLRPVVVWLLVALSRVSHFNWRQSAQLQRATRYGGCCVELFSPHGVGGETWGEKVGGCHAP